MEYQTIFTVGKGSTVKWFNEKIRGMERKTDFRFRVHGLYYCRNLAVPQIGPYRDEMFEISIRLESEEKWCRDTINGEMLKILYPNVAWKRPGGEIITRMPLPRDTIAFRYPRETMEEFFRIGMEPKVNGNAFIMSAEIESLSRKFMELIPRLYTPGVPDQIDWVCFQLYKTLLSPSAEKNEEDSQETVIRNISLWLQSHYDEPVNMSELAGKNGMSHADFYVKWKKVFAVTPVQYLINLKLEAAAQRLIQTEKPISEIVREVRFSNLYAFHKRFRQKFGISPGEYRKRHSSDPVILPI